jgi:16S rRNA G966 N2-methylase RsmD
LDPPYGLDLWKPASDLLLEKGKLRDGAILVMEHGEKQSLKGLDPRLELIKERKYGLILVTIYRYREIPEGSGDQDEVAPIGEQ